MPELPEIITIREDLKKEVIGKKVNKVKTYNGYPLKPSPKYFEKFVTGHKIVEISNTAKLITIKMSSDFYVATHLRMTGNLLFNTNDKYKKVTLYFSDNSYMHFSTIRKFGFFEVWDKNKLDTYAKRFGKTVLESNLEAEEFKTLLLKKKTNIKTALLDQSIISGVGNIYANDALFLAKIHPIRNVHNLTDAEFEILFKKLNLVLKAGVKNRGSSIDRFKDLYGNPGNHQKYFHIYGRKGNLCTRCGINRVEYSKIQGRGTFYCSVCQPIEPKKNR